MPGLTVRDLGGMVNDVIAIAYDAGEKILEVYNSRFSVEHKADKSPLTMADIAAHNAISAALNRLTPDIPVLSEESAAIPYSTRRTWSQYWLVDPMDGTREFVKRNGEFTVNIAFIDAGRPLLGVIQRPVSSVCYYGICGQGAYKQNADGSKTVMSTKSTDLNELVIVSSRSHGNAKQQAFLEQFPGAEVVSVGSSLKLCMIAEGLIDIYPRFGPTSEWDIAAAQAIVEEAGGIMADMGNKRLLYNQKDSLINPWFVAIADRGFDWQPYLPGSERDERPDTGGPSAS